MSCSSWYTFIFFPRWILYFSTALFALTRYFILSLPEFIFFSFVLPGLTTSFSPSFPPLPSLCTFAHPPPSLNIFSSSLPSSLVSWLPPDHLPPRPSFHYTFPPGSSITCLFSPLLDLIIWSLVPTLFDTISWFHSHRFSRSRGRVYFSRWLSYHMYLLPLLDLIICSLVLTSTLFNAIHRLAFRVVFSLSRGRRWALYSHTTSLR